jgi:hypothetical protein
MPARRTTIACRLAMIALAVIASVGVMFVFRPQTARAADGAGFSAFFLRDGKIGTGQDRTLPTNGSPYDVVVKEVLAGSLDSEVAVGLRTYERRCRRASSSTKRRRLRRSTSQRERDTPSLSLPPDPATVWPRRPTT